MPHNFAICYYSSIDLFSELNLQVNFSARILIEFTLFFVLQWNAHFICPQFFVGIPQFLRWICFKNYKGNESVIKNSLFLKYRWKNFDLSSVCPSISNLSFLLIGLFSNGHVRQMSKGRHSFWLKIFGVVNQALQGIA